MKKRILNYFPLARAFFVFLMVLVMVQTGVTVNAQAESSGGAELNLSWTQASASDTDDVISGNITHLVLGEGGTMTAINGSGRIIVSGDNGQNWTVSDTGSFLPRDIAYDGSAFIAAGNGIMASSDGSSWTPVTVSGAAIDWSTAQINTLTTAVTSKGVVTVAAGNSGLILVTDPSFENTYTVWYKLHNPNPNASSVYFVPPFSYVPQHQSGSSNISEEFVGYGTGSIYTITANLGSSTFFSVSATGDNIIVPNLNKVWYDNVYSLFFGTYPEDGRYTLYSSPTLAFWTNRGTYENLKGTAYGAGTSVMVGAGGMIYTSDDGAFWSSQQITSGGTHPDLNAVTYEDGIFAAVGNDGTILTSEDGDTWQSCSSGTTGNLTSISYANGKFVAGGNGIILLSGMGTPDGVCAIGSTQYETLDAALDSVGAGQTVTIKLLNNIDYYKGINVGNGSDITFDLNGFDLNVNNSGSTGLTVTSGSISYTGQGELNIAGNSFGVNVNKDTSADAASAVVFNATAFGSGSYGAYSSNGGRLTVNNDVTGGACGVWAFTSGSSITVLGDVTATSPEGTGAIASANGQVTVGGHITAAQYITVNGENKDGSADSRTAPTTKNGYYTFSVDGSGSTVWVKVSSTDIWPRGSELKAAETTHNSMVLSWPAANGAVDYSIYKGSAVDGSSGGTLTYAAIGLSPDTAYTFRVDAYSRDAGWIEGPSVLARTDSAPKEPEDTGKGSGGTSRADLPVYQAEIKSGTNQMVPVVVDSASKAGTVKLDTLKTESIFTGKSMPKIIFPKIPDVKAYKLELPAAALSNTQVTGSLTLMTETGSLSIPRNMLASSSGIQGKTAVIVLSEGDKAGIPDDIKAVIGDHPIIQLTLTLDGKQTEWNNPEAPVTVSMPYRPTALESANPESIVIWYLDGSDKLVCIPNGHYDAGAGTVTFDVTHFSLYAVGYHTVSFADAAPRAWYFKAVSFLGARDIAGGTGGGDFSPDTKLTRSQFVVMLMRAYGIDSVPNSPDNFSDAGDAYYTDYLAAAKHLGISNGTGNNLFSPDQAITRQELFTMLYNALKTIDKLHDVNTEKRLGDFTDTDQIAPWATDSMMKLAEAGIIYGNNGRIDPRDTATRAEMAQVLYRLLSE